SAASTSRPTTSRSTCLRLHGCRHWSELAARFWSRVSFAAARMGGASLSRTAETRLNRRNGRVAKAHRAFIGAGVGLVVAGSVATFTPVTKAVAASNPITFGVPSVMDPIHTFGEPDIGVDALGHVFVSGPTGTGTQRSLWEGSVDGGT